MHAHIYIYVYIAVEWEKFGAYRWMLGWSWDFWAIASLALVHQLAQQRWAPFAPLNRLEGVIRMNHEGCMWTLNVTPTALLNYCFRVVSIMFCIGREGSLKDGNYTAPCKSLQHCYSCFIRDFKTIISIFQALQDTNRTWFSKYNEMLVTIITNMLSFGFALFF